MFVGVVVEEEGIPVFHVGVEEVDSGVPVNGNDRHVIEEDLFGLAEFVIAEFAGRRCSWPHG